MKALEMTRSGIVGTIAVVVVALVCVRLGLWQLDRREERRTRNAAVEARAGATPVRLTSAPLDTAGLTFRRATVTGMYDNARTVILGARALGGAPGVHVYTPLRVGGDAILVNRGWVPSADAATVDASAMVVDSIVTVAGRLLPIPETGAGGVASGFRTTWFRLDAGPLLGQFPYPVSPLYLQVESRDEVAALRSAWMAPGSPAPLPAMALDGGPHLSYAIQWFSFGAIFLVGWAALVMRGAGTPGGRGRYQQRVP